MENYGKLDRHLCKSHKIEGVTYVLKPQIVVQFVDFPRELALGVPRSRRGH